MFPYNAFQWISINVAIASWIEEEWIPLEVEYSMGQYHNLGENVL